VSSHLRGIGSLAGRALQGQLSLRFIVLTTVVLFWIAAVLIGYMLILRTYYHLRAKYLASRRKLYEPAVEMVLMEEPREKILEAFRPRRWLDEEPVQEVLLEAMEHLIGDSFALLQGVAVELGFVERNLKLLKSSNHFRKGNAMEALGIMKAPAAIPVLIAMMPELTQDMKLSALRALALIGDPSALPSYRSAADALPQAMLPRLASLMLEYGKAAAPYIQSLVRDHPHAFPPRVMQLLRAETAAAEGLE
jgi:hypothetical protein